MTCKCEEQEFIETPYFDGLMGAENIRNDFAKGFSIEEIADQYGVDELDVEKTIRWFLNNAK